MSKIAICYFSYYKDKDFLNNSLKVLEKTIKNNTQHEVRTYVFDDGRCEKSLKRKELHGSPTLIKTNFDRKGNLNGYECIEGMFSEYKKIQDKFDYDYLIKLDSDCCLNSFDYIKVAEEEMKKANIPLSKLGQMGTYFATMCVVGCCQTFGKTCVNSLNFLFNSLKNPTTNERRILKKRIELGYNEDKVISILVEMSPLVKINVDKLNGIKGNCNAFEMNDGSDYSSYTSVAFKPNYFTLNKGKWTREYSLNIMENFVSKK